MELEKVYEPKKVEDRLYKKWIDNKYFHAEIDKTKEPFTIVIPPPNITGQLHMGHAFDETLQDILIRWKRMQGYCTLWVPGTDHASISTEVKIAESMAKEGLSKADIGRDEFLKRAWDWKKQYGGKIVEQLKKLGCSCDWDRERFTLDEGLSKAVLTVFVNLYNKGLIYRGEKIVNWCPKCKTTISDAEVEHEDKLGHFWHIKYYLKDSDEFLQIATTRPETLLGDTAVAVNPKDERYQKYVGKTVILPILNKEIPVVADDYVDMEFGTGVVKITPAHDPNDFEVGNRHNLERINIMNDDGTINDKGGKYAGMDRYEARKALVSDLETQNLLVKIEDHTHAVGTHERCHETVEPLIKLQWFVKMESLAKPALEAYYNKEVNFIPERFGKIYVNWLDGIKDWCISRQLWWGHRIPAYYCEDCGNVEVSQIKPSKCSKCNSNNLKQDEDTLDTWFSSALWPFSTLGWPDNTEDFNYFYPTNVLVTAYDIIFFWVVRMVFSGIEHTGKVPFKDVLMHGLIRDAEGKKFSKSLGNGIDPLEVVEKYGADALRLTLVTGNAAGNDMRFYDEKVEANRNFNNKLWNASRFVLMNFDDINVTADLNELTTSDKWIISKSNKLIKEVTENLENYDLGVAAQKIQDFLWDEYCDWYIEMVKPRLYNKEASSRNAALFTLKTVLIDTLKLLHPFMPFITEEIFMHIQDKEETIMVSAWPIYDEAKSFETEEKEIEIIKEAVKGIRNIRSEMNVPPSKKTKVFVVSDNQNICNIFNKSNVFFGTLAYASEVIIQNDKSNIQSDAISVVIPNATIYIPFAELVDIHKEIERLNKEYQKLIKEVERVDKKLANQGFVSKAPAAVIEEEKAKHQKYNDMLNQVQKQLENLKVR